MCVCVCVFVGVLLRLTPSKSHFQLWRTEGADQSQGFCFGTHTHAAKDGGGRGLQSVFVCGASL